MKTSSRHSLSEAATPARRAPAVTHYVYGAANGFFFILYAFSLARLHAVWFDPRFALVALGVCTSGLALGAALSETAWVRRLGTAWVGASGLFAALGAAILVFARFGSPYVYVLATSLPALALATWVMGISGLTGSWNSACRFRGAITAASGVTVAAIITLWLFDLPSGPLVTALIAAAGVGLAALLVAPASGAALAVLVIGLLAATGMTTDWRFSPAIKWEQTTGEPLAKVRYVPATSTQGPVRSSSVWGRFSLVELASDAAAGGNVQSIYVNGIFQGLIPAPHPNAGSGVSLEQEFPIVALPFLTANPQKIVLVNPHGAVELRMALQRQIPEVHVFAQRNNLRAFDEARSLAGDLLSGNGVVTHATTTPTWRPAGLDQLYLAIPQPHVAGWTEIDSSENFLFTSEAFRTHWGRLKPGGMLVVLAGDQTLYVRALLQAWEALPKEHRDRRPLAAQAWGFRMLASRPGLRPYEYVAMITKGPVDPETVNRVTGQAKDMPLVPLFGPGIAPGAIYAALAHPGGTAVALPAIGQYLVRQQNLLVDIFPATEDRPFFFQPIRDLNPYLKWLVGIGLITLAYAFIVPLAPLRRLEHPDNALRLPIPVYLAFFALASTGFAGAITALIWEGMRYAELGSLLITTTIGMVIGAATGLWIYVRRQASRETEAWRLATVVFAGMGALTAAYVVVAAPRWASSMPEIYAPLAALLAGMTAASAIPGALAGLRHSSSVIPGVASWAWTAIASGVLLGPIAALWIAQFHGWNRTWTILVGALIVAAALSVLLGRPTQHAKAAGDRTRARR